MKPYYEHAGISIFHGDCRDILPRLPKARCAIVDPPYGDTSLEWDQWVCGWPEVVRRSLEPAGSLWCFGSLKMFLRHADEFTDWRHVQEVVWEKHNGSSFHADRFRRVHELIAHYVGREVTWEEVYKQPVFTQDATARTIRRPNRPAQWGKHIRESRYVSEDGGPRLMRSVIYARSCHGYAEHPTQKPVAILEPLIEYSCPPGELVLDPMCGAGSVLVAAKRLGRQAVGIETREECAETAARRLAQGVLELV